MIAARLALLVLALGILSAWLDAERRGVEATVTPRAGLPPLRVLLLVFSDEPGLTCPSILVEWAEGNSSFQESDCDPTDMPDTFSFSRRSPGGYGPGKHEIRVTLEQGTKRVLRIASFFVGGGEE